MAGVNKVILVGRLGKDPEVRNFQNGGKVVNLSVATSETWKDKDGNRQERTEWHRVAIFNEKLGEIAERYLFKGSEVYLEGQIETRKWQDASGADKFSTEVVLRQFRGDIALIGGRQQGGGDARQDDRGGQQQQQRPAAGGNGAAPSGGHAAGGGGGRPQGGGQASYGGGRGTGGDGQRGGGGRGGGQWDAPRGGGDLDDDIPF
jgi:single-strand DNA-binding protein